ncbi:MAG TPA: hypothetical protein VID73_03955 [Ktedonobacterales bacterium]
MPRPPPLARAPALQGRDRPITARCPLDTPAPRRGYVVASAAPGAWDAERARRLRAAVSDLLAVAWQLGVDGATLRGEIERQLSAGARAAPAPPAPDRPAS